MLYPRSALRTPPQSASAGATATEDRAAGRWSAYAPVVMTVLAAFLVTRIILFAAIALSMASIHTDAGTPPVAHSAPSLLMGLLRWDSLHYAHIVMFGYDPLRTVFFPLFPLLVKGVSVLVGNAFVAGVIASNAAFLAALGYVYALARREYDRKAAGRAVFYLASAPGAVVFAAIYTESLFALLVAATFYYARSSRWAPAALAAALASATRNTGVLLAAVILIEALSQNGVRLRPIEGQRMADYLHDQRDAVVRAWRGLLAAAVAPLGLLAYMLYLAHTYHDPLFFVHEEAKWGRGFAWTNWTYLIPKPPMTTTVAIDTLTVVVFAVLVVAVAMRMRLSYGIFTALTFLVSALSEGAHTTAMTRYVLMLIPCFVLLGAWGRSRRVDHVITLVSLPLMIYVAVLFCHWAGPV